MSEAEKAAPPEPRRQPPAVENLLPFRCQSRQCMADMADKGEPTRVMFIPEKCACQCCGSRKYLYPLAVVHYLEQCDEGDSGALQGRNGMFKITCGASQKEAKRLSTERDVTDGDGYFSAPIVTCHKCRELTKDKQPPLRQVIQV